MAQVAEQILKTQLIDTEVLKSRCFILVDAEGNPVVEFRAGQENTLQIMDKHGNICTEIRIGQTPGKELRSS